MPEERNQKIKADAGKPRLSLVPMQIMRDIAVAREYGLNKYGSADSWKEVDRERYVDAMLRHAVAYAENSEGVDEESGLLHLAHLACNVAFLCEMDKSIKDARDFILNDEADVIERTLSGIEADNVTADINSAARATSDWSLAPKRRCGTCAHLKKLGHKSQKCTSCKFQSNWEESLVP